MNKFEESKYALRLSQDNLYKIRSAFDKGESTGNKLEEAYQAHKKAQDVWCEVRKCNPFTLDPLPITSTTGNPTKTGEIKL